MSIHTRTDVLVKPGGDAVLVTLDNLEEYLERLLTHILVEAPEPVMKAILAGFAEVSARNPSLANTNTTRPNAPTCTATLQGPALL